MITWTEVQLPQDAFRALLNNEFLSDIKFKFNDRTIFAHSFVLCCRSVEFYNSFKATIGVERLIPVNDSTYDEFLEFLMHLYTNTTEINSLYAAGVIQLARKYKLQELETLCVAAMLEDIEVGNACVTLQNALEIQHDALTIAANEFIAKNYLASLSHESFRSVKYNTLRAILLLDPVSDNDEFKIFEHVLEWATQTCINECNDVSANLKRVILNENLQLIRFGAMTAAEFAKCQEIEPGLLKSDETVSIFLSITSGKEAAFGFSKEKRNLL